MHEYRTRRCAEVLAGIINILINITIKLTKNIKLHSSKMGIAETDKRPSRDIHDVRPQTAKHRSILKRRPIQLTSNYLHGTFCTNLQRQWNRRRMRRLFSIDRTEAMGLKSRWELVWELCLYIIYFVVPMLAILGFNCGLNCYENSEMFSSLVQRYTSQYYATVHNKVNYCDRTMPLYDMFEHINGAVINQATALRELKEALDKQNFQSIALVGTTGLGKTLTVRNLLEIYPWPENTQTIAWNDYELIDNESRYKVVLKALRNLSHCGRNLIVIDNMAMCDMEYVPAINKMVMSFGDVATGPHNEIKKQVAIIFVFNANSMLPKEHYIKQLNSLKKIEATSIIEYRGFEREDVEMCVRHEQYQLGLKLDQRHYEDIINSTNVKITGCKTVRAKVLLHGEPVKTIEELFSTEEDEF